MNHGLSFVRTLRTAAILALAGLVLAAPAGAVTAYFSYPDIHGDRIVFCAEADLWIVAAAGGVPQRLTTHPGTEYFPQFSPDGRWIAFTGQYDGNSDVYVIPAGGGEPQRSTWHPGGDEVVGWMPDGDRIIFRSSRTDPHGSTHLFTVDRESGAIAELPLGWAVRLAVDPDSGLWAFNRKSRERATWKRYRGGTASDIWVGHPERADFRVITDFPGMDHFPMWHAGRIYFLSDQGGTANIFSIAPDGSDRRRHTDYDEWDARWPNMGPDGRIVFTLAADVHIFDPATGRVARVAIDLPSDRQLTRTRYPNPERYISEIDLAKDGERLAVVARGEIFSVPVKDGVTLPVTRGTGSRERSVIFSPDGERILYITDEPHEDEFRVIDAWGRGEPEIVRSARSGWHRQPIWSPDGEKIAFADNSYGLFVMPADGGAAREIDRGTMGEITEYTWSPDGRWLAYVKELPSEFRAIFLYDTTEREIQRITSPYADSYAPAWDPEGRFLFFASDRAVNPILGGRDTNVVEAKSDMLYMLLLRDDVENPLAQRAGLPPSDEEGEDGEDGGKGDDENAKDEDAGDEDAEKVEPVEIDLAGIEQRIVELPVDRGRYNGLAATESHLFYVSAPLAGMAEWPGLFQQGEPTNTLMSFDLKEKEAKTFVAGIYGYILNAKAGKLAVMKGRGKVYVVDAGAPPGGDLEKSKVDLSGIVVELDPRAEWEQIYYEAWRQMREYYWDPDMGGVDWEGVRDRYATLLPRLASRADLTDLLGQIFGEMNTSHTYVFGGDRGVDVDRVAVGLLGALFERDRDAFRVVRVYRGDPADRVFSPLDEPGSQVKEGEYIVAVNRVPIAGPRPLPAYLENLAGKEVILAVNDEPELDGAREVVVKPVGNERELIYADWVRRNREYVLEKTDGKIGYLHIPDMMMSGMIEFDKWFYPQLDKEGMVVDMRWNGGGFVSQILVERFRRPVLSWSLYRGGATGTYPDRVLNGPFVVLTNEFAGSDGDIFPQAIQLNQLAPIIGMRSWGGVIGIASMRPLVDGGLITNPQVAWWDPKDGWGLENRGVIPDIEVQNLPQELARGEDAQLDRGIQEVLRLHREHPPAEPDFGAVPARNRRAFERELRR